MSSMLVVGSVAFDTIHNHLGTHERVLGGSAVYASLAASHFVPSRIVGVVGNDFPAAATELLRSRGVDTEGLEVAKGKTFHWEGRYSDDLTSRTSLSTELNVFADFHPKIPEKFRTTPFVMLGNIDPVLQMEVLDQMERPRIVIADTMNFWISGKKPDLLKMLRRIDLLVINEEESRELTGQHAITRVARALLEMGPKIVVIKRGEYGALMFAQNEVFSAPAYPCEEVVDPTGAGDTFAGGMIGYLAHAGEASPTTLRKAVIYGSALASFCVEGVAVGRLATVTREEVESRYLQFQRLAHFATPGELQTMR